MADPYCTKAELEAYLGGPSPVDDLRLRGEASAVLDEYVIRPFTADATTGLPTDAVIAGVMRDACCAQVAYWLEVGEEHDIEGTAGHDVSLGGYSGKLPSTLAPRALRALRNGGMMGQLRRDVFTEFATTGNA